MYSTVPACHIAIDAKLQLLNSNRKISIHPEQYDMALNEAIRQIINQRQSAKLNSKQEGFEQSIKRYDDLQSLKKVAQLNVFNNGFKYFSYLPSDYLSYDLLVGNLKYNRNGIRTTYVPKTLYYTVCNFSNVSTLSNISFNINGNTTVNATSFGNIVKSSKSLFYFYNTFKEYIKSEYNIDCYYENFNDRYYKNSLIFVTTDFTKRVTSCSLIGVITTVNSNVLNTLAVADDCEHLLKNNIKFDLLSSLNEAIKSNDYYMNKNLHINPSATILGDSIYINKHPNFIVHSLKLEYIKQPRLINSTLNQMSDFEVTDEVIDKAVANISLIIKDETYQFLQQKEQLNN